MVITHTLDRDSVACFPRLVIEAGEDSEVTVIEPAWKLLLSNKGILPLLWAMFPRHPNLLPAYFEDDPKATSLGSSFVRKPLYSREGANVSIVVGGVPAWASPCESAIE